MNHPLHSWPIPHRHLVVGGFVLTLLLAVWTPAAAQRTRRQPVREATPTAAQGPATTAPAAPLPLAEYFPADTLLYLEVERITNVIDEVLAADNFRNFLASADSPLPIDLTRYDEALVAFGLPDKATIGATRFGLGLTLIPGKDKYGLAPAIGIPKPEVELVGVVIAPDDAAATRYVELGSQWLPALVNNGKSAKPVTGRVGRFQTTTFPARKANESLMMARSGQVIAVGLSPVMKRWLAQVSRPGFAPLGKSKGFEEVRRQLTRPYNGLVYINTTSVGGYVRQLLTDLLQPRPSAKTASRERVKAKAEFAAKVNQLIELSGVGVMDGVGYACGVQAGRVMQEIVVGVDRAAPGLYPAFVDGPRVNGYAANFLPDNTQIFATMSVNATRVYDTLRQMAGVVSAKYETDIQAAERKFGVNFRQEIAAALTGEIAFGVGGLRVAEMFSGGDPLSGEPHSAVFAVSNNPQALRDAFAKIFSFAVRKAADRRAQQAAQQATVNPAEGEWAVPPKPIFEPRTKIYEGETIWLFSGENDKEEEAFAVAVVANVLVAGRTSDVKWVIDSYRRGQTLGRREDFNVGFSARPADAMGSFYLAHNFFVQILEGLRRETPKRYQPFLEGLTPFSFFTHIGREGRAMISRVDLPLSFMVGVAGASYGSMAAADERRANEQAVCDVLRAIYEAQMAYARGPGQGSYSDSLPTLAKRADGGRAFEEEVELMHRLPYKGYILGPIVLRPAGGGKPAGFSVTAFPAVRTGPDRTGDYTYYLDETGKLRCRDKAAEDADADSPACRSFAEEAAPGESMP
ncbi:MAG: hypothetical protein NZ585_01265 [Chloracidobacterium sp.]|nr:hypothetical protein [Chloracidobacterium sp.]MDW8216364.1 hypothetical protein [Acidobacteriota bacterium]